MFKGNCFPKAIILQAVYFKLRFSLSYRDIEELLRIRGMVVNHATIQRQVIKFTPIIDKNFRKRKKKPGMRWKLDETYIQVKGKWCYLYRAVDKQGIRTFNKRELTRIQWRQCKYLNNIFEQDIDLSNGECKICLGLSHLNQPR